VTHEPFVFNSRPWQLVYKEVYPNKSDAMKREKELKTSTGRNLIRAIIKTI